MRPAEAPDCVGAMELTQAHFIAPGVDARLDSPFYAGSATRSSASRFFLFHRGARTALAPVAGTRQQRIDRKG
jgi:hypothetical protein